MNGQVRFVILKKSALREIPSACTLCYCWWQNSNGYKGGQVFVEVLIETFCSSSLSTDGDNSNQTFLCMVIRLYRAALGLLV